MQEMQATMEQLTKAIEHIKVKNNNWAQCNEEGSDHFGRGHVHRQPSIKDSPATNSSSNKELNKIILEGPNDVR